LNQAALRPWLIALSTTYLDLLNNPYSNDKPTLLEGLLKDTKAALVLALEDRNLLPLCLPLTRWPSWAGFWIKTLVSGGYGCNDHD